MAPGKIRVIAILFFALIGIGCSGDGTFERPDTFEVTTLEAVHGQTGHRADVMVAKEGEEVVRQMVLVVRDSDVSAAPIYIVIGYTSGAPHSTDQSTIDAVELIDHLHTAASVALVPSLPKGTKQKGGILYGGNTLLCYLRVTKPSDTLYWSVRTSREKIDEVFEHLAKPPKVLDTVPATVTEISYYSDGDLTMPLVNEAVVGDTIYSKVVFSKDVPIVFADDGNAKPSISSSIGQEEFRYRMRPWGTDLQNGDAKPHQNTENIFVCKYEVQTNDFDRMFRTYGGHHKTAGAALHILFFKYTGEIPANTPETITGWQPQDFVGKVYTRLPLTEDETSRSIKASVAGVTVTIASGPYAGESAITDRNGRYRFLNIKGDALHLRTEKTHFEPKEVIVHRSRPTSLPDGSVPNHHGDPQKEPGNILIGQAWPKEVRPILEEVLLVHDLLYIEIGTPPENSHIAGAYGSGLVFMASNNFAGAQNLAPVLKVFEHEIAHAHQHAVVSVDGSADIQQWIHSPEGKAYEEARQKDLELGEKMYYDVSSYFTSSLLENAAEHCAAYWGEKRGAKLRYWSDHQFGKTLKELAPNRFKWAEEWLTKK